VELFVLVKLIVKLQSTQRLEYMLTIRAYRIKFVFRSIRTLVVANFPFTSEYLKRRRTRKGRVFSDLTRPELDGTINSYFKKLRIKGKFSPHSLRHTAGQLMYERKIPIELIQKTLRHADMRTTMMYSQKAIDRNYFKRLKRF
jgi:integrase